MKILEFLNNNDYDDFLLKTGHPKVGFNAATGQPAPEKQQTVRPFREIRKSEKIYVETNKEQDEFRGKKVTLLKARALKTEFHPIEVKSIT